MFQIIYEHLIHYLQKHPLFGFISSAAGSVLAWKEYIGTLLSWAGGGVMIMVGMLTAYAKYLEIQERKMDVRKKRSEENSKSADQ